MNGYFLDATWIGIGMIGLVIAVFSFFFGYFNGESDGIKIGKNQILKEMEQRKSQQSWSEWINKVNQAMGGNNETQG